MKRILLILAAFLTITGTGAMNSVKTEGTNGDDDQKAIAFITDMFNNTKYEDIAFLKSHCTSKMIVKLKADYDYDCYEGDCLATWDFRSENQDGPSDRTEIIKVEPAGGGWYNYSFYDMGNKGKNAIKLLINGNDIKIDGLKAGGIAIKDNTSSIHEEASDNNTAATEAAVEDNNVYSAAEQMPSFKGNVNQWLAQNLRYPTEAAENGIQGKVIVKFIVRKDGSISDAKVVRRVAPSLDKEAVRVIGSMPNWNPGMKDGKPVNVWFTMPITFRM